jgi:rRNA maturation endonuclease Nob1
MSSSGHITKRRGKSGRRAIVVDLGQQPVQRCMSCGKAGVFWVEKDKRLPVCPRCGGPPEERKQRRQQWHTPPPS